MNSKAYAHSRNPLSSGSSGQPTRDPATLRAEIIRALSHAVDGEHRYGNRLDVRPELDARWLKVIDGLEELWRTARQKPAAR